MILASIFRDAESTVPRYIDQIKALREYLPVDVIAVEGDSVDDTYAMLLDTDFKVLKCETGGPLYGSVDWGPRWRQLAACGNIALNAAAYRMRSDPLEPFCYVEQDLMWTPQDMLTLLDDLTRVRAVAPLSILERDGLFYDTWGYTLNGRRFSRHYPYHSDIDLEALSPIDTCGSCFVIEGPLINAINFSPTECPRGIGQSLAAHGERLYLDPTVKVVHP